jgi:hypothetical protein
LGQKQILRPSQKVLAVRFPAVVDSLFDVGQQIRRVLDFVKDDGRRVHIEKTTRVGPRRRAHVWRLERNIAERFAKDMLQQCGLARLAWSRQDHRRELRGGLSEDWLQRTRDVTTAHGQTPSCNYAL